MGSPCMGTVGLFRFILLSTREAGRKIPKLILQLTAQAMCLEEMLSCTIGEGAIFYGEVKRRERVGFSEDLKTQVKDIFAEIHQLFNKKYTPRVKWSKGCNACSLKDICLPKLGKASSVREYIHDAIGEEDSKSRNY